MVAVLRGRGVSPAILDALTRVPRHLLVPHFWALTDVEEGALPVPVEYEADDERALIVLYDPDIAVAVNLVPGPRVTTTSTASAPGLLAVQADELALEPGMSVLEIGTGPGYFAALLAELVGPAGSVVTVDIDASVSADATAALADCGYGQVEVITGDGHVEPAARGPFDRVVASVGCRDVSPAWLRQLAPDGFALVPLQHGCSHPMVRVGPDGTGRCVTRSGYVTIQGRQAETSMWPHAAAVVEPTDHEPLDDELAGVLAVASADPRTVPVREWDLGFWVALHDDRAGFLAALNDGDGSSARIDRAAGRVEWGGPCGRRLADALGAHAAAWLAADGPRLEDYEHRFVPRDGGPSATPGDRRWVIERTDHHQLVVLASVGPRMTG